MEKSRGSVVAATDGYSLYYTASLLCELFPRGPRCRKIYDLFYRRLVMRNGSIKEALEQLDVILHIVEVAWNQIEIHFNENGDSFPFHSFS
jgi:hypothetical protein